jgi:hypothetical protein
MAPAPAAPQACRLPNQDLGLAVGAQTNQDGERQRCTIAAICLNGISVSFNDKVSSPDYENH